MGILLLPEKLSRWELNKDGYFGIGLHSCIKAAWVFSRNQMWIMWDWRGELTLIHFISFPGTCLKGQRRSSRIQLPERWNALLMAYGAPLRLRPHTRVSLKDMRLGHHHAVFWLCPPCEKLSSIPHPQASCLLRLQTFWGTVKMATVRWQRRWPCSLPSQVTALNGVPNCPPRTETFKLNN